MHTPFIWKLSSATCNGNCPFVFNRMQPLGECLTNSWIHCFQSIKEMLLLLLVVAVSPSPAESTAAFFEINEQSTAQWSGTLPVPCCWSTTTSCSGCKYRMSSNKGRGMLGPWGNDSWQAACNSPVVRSSMLLGTVAVAAAWRIKYIRWSSSSHVGCGCSWEGSSFTAITLASCFSFSVVFVFAFIVFFFFLFVWWLSIAWLTAFWSNVR